ncbi:hypothetical protein ES319_A12G110300v1 [Gossypium barbadense]|uniref:Subtilisin-like protease SBT1.1 n=1 Tax=Gossypium barbadense TaxID=3634 RepID=A0A5J5T8S1_GOSBA|nr:hypothetical protein ES319_A12G110300v1 [Gossypium barbadense]
METATMMCKTAMLMLIFIVTPSNASMNMQTYIVHMDRTKMTTTTSDRWYESVIESVNELLDQEDHESGKPKLVHVYKTAISGFAAKLSTKQVESLKRLNGFISATPDEMLALHTTHSPQFRGLERGKGLWSGSNLESDVIIGVVDSGIWPEHVSFNDIGECEEGTKFSKSNCNKKLIGARAFFEGYEAAVGKINETEDYRSARDAEGHGTHTASTAAGNLAYASIFGLAKGLAGGVRYTSRIAVYKKCWSQGCASSDILAAIDQAIADGVDVLSLSLGGSAKPYHSDPIAIGAFQAIKNGIFVSCSAGNSGPSSSTVSNTAPWIMTVGASYLDRSFEAIVELGDRQIFEGSSLYVGKALKQLPLFYGNTIGDLRAAFCIDGSLKKNLVKGKIVICQRGITSRTEKGEVVKLAGGAGMLLINSVNEGEELFADAHVLPASALGAIAGKAIKAYLNSTNKPTASITFKGTVYGKLAPLMAAFSSRGPNHVGLDLLKPNVTAPGMNILAAWPPSTSPTELKSDKRTVLFNIASGTSMSCPHVSGLAALLKSVHKDWSPAAIKSALMTTAYVHDNSNRHILDVAFSTPTNATPFAYGSGHVNPEKASDPGLIYDINPQDYQNYLCTLNYSASDMALFAGDGFNKSNIVTLKRTVTHVGIPNVTYTVQVNEPDGVSVMVEPQVLRFKKPSEKLSYKVSFMQKKGFRVQDGSFGVLEWVYLNMYHVRSSIAVTWT